MAELINRTVRISNIIRNIDILTHSNHSRETCFCDDCLGKSKTNKKYLIYSQAISLNPYRKCQDCGVMTLANACKEFDMKADLIALLAERGDEYDCAITGERLTFVFLNQLYLRTLKKAKS